ncbi:MAG: endonuclease domain-containing protein [Gammaproteobacteria bacterium]
MKQLAKTLRRNQTEAEKRIWHHLRNRGLVNYKFKRQYEIGPYIVDFICLERQLIVEIDGGQHVSSFEKDTQRTLYLQSQGFKVIRFWNDEVLKNTANVLDVIANTLLKYPSPQPSPLAGEKETNT